MVPLFQSSEARAVSRPLRSSVNSAGRTPFAPRLPTLIRVALPSSAYMPRPCHFSVSL